MPLYLCACALSEVICQHASECSYPSIKCVVRLLCDSSPITALASLPGRLALFCDRSPFALLFRLRCTNASNAHLAPLVIGSELGRTLGCLHKDRCGNAAVESRCSVDRSRYRQHNPFPSPLRCPDRTLGDQVVAYPSLATILRKQSPALQLDSSLDHVQRVHDQDLRHTGHRTGGELVDERQRLFGRHGGGWLSGCAK
ncbi:hypothetical protein KC357_g294 [Hortaea werneckii]|nr:hypothetical protein KC357_g294 [Hortaea werneckii]